MDFSELTLSMSQDVGEKICNDILGAALVDLSLLACRRIMFEEMRFSRTPFNSFRSPRVHGESSSINLSYLMMPRGSRVVYALYSSCPTA